MHNLVIGSGPAAAGVALALTEASGQQVTVLDIGERLEQPQRDAVARLGRQKSEQWSPDDLELVTAQPVAQVAGALPQKRTYGSAYPFDDQGQLSGVRATAGANANAISGAYGGFSNVWGAQVMPFTASTFARWPMSWSDMEPHYRAVLQEVPLAGEVDDLAELFPLLDAARPLPPLAPRSREVLERYQRHRQELRRQGVVVGRARLAFRAQDCVRCGLCMTGCPYALIWSSAQTFDRLVQRGRVAYHSGLLVQRVEQTDEGVVAWALELSSGRVHEFRADRMFIACGGLGTTRLVLGSMSAPPAHVDLAESVQFVVPLLSRHAVVDPRGPGSQEFTLNQFNILLDLDGQGYETSQIHCYPYNPACMDALPAPLQHRRAAAVTGQLVRRLTAGLGYLPSWVSPRVRVTHQRSPDGGLPGLVLGPHGTGTPDRLRTVVRGLLRAAPRLDLWPVVPKVQVSGAAKSYHFGSSFPHGTSAPNGTDMLGRLPEWSRIHLVDGAVLPEVPSTTFTLTVMANAHRIATAALAEDVDRVPGASCGGNRRQRVRGAARLGAVQEQRVEGCSAQSPDGAHRR